MIRHDYLRYRAYNVWRNGEPCPYDLYLELSLEGMSYEILEEMFEQGYMPQQGDLFDFGVNTVDLFDAYDVESFDELENYLNLKQEDIN
jgi:hypothetical protein